MPRKLKSNPFRPGKPITDPELFAGRRDELLMLVDSLFQTGNGNARHIIITGARGVGKSSLANQIDRLTSGDRVILRELDVDAGDFGFNFVVCKHTAVKSQTTADIVASLVDKIPWRISKENVIETFQGFLKRWKVKDISFGGAVGVEYNATVSSDLSTDFVRAVEVFWKAAKTNTDGVLFLVDEVDTVADTDLASFCKITTEAMTDKGLENVAFVLVGINGAMEKLKQEHPSVGRIFETVEVQPMTEEELANIIDRSLSGTGVSTTGEVKSRIIKLAAGFPSPVHLLGYHSFDEDNDSVIDVDDFERALDKVVGIVKREELGGIYKKAGSGDLRRILQLMVDYEHENVPLKYLADGVGRPSNSVSVSMKSLRERGVVERVDRALYKIVDPLLKVYIQKFGILQPELFDEEVLVDEDEIGEKGDTGSL